MANYTTCPRCGARYDVTTAPDGTALVCDECGFEFLVEYETENVIPGGLTVKTKVLADGSRWIECPKCGLSSDVTKISPGNRFRCQRCQLLLQVPRTRKPGPRKTRSLKGEDILTCPSCKTKYDVSGYTPGNRFRCRSCGLSLTVPPRGDWLGSGEWEIDVVKGLIKCNNCGKSYPITALDTEEAFVCKNCRRGFSPSHELGEVEKRPEPPRPARDDEWELSLDTGMVRCLSCRYSYDISGMKPGADFVCPRCNIVFRMPQKLATEADREQVLCPSCGEAYDVSGYLRGTMFTCQKCETVIHTGPARPGGDGEPGPDASAGGSQATETGESPDAPADEPPSVSATPTAPAASEDRAGEEPAVPAAGAEEAGAGGEAPAPPAGETAVPAAGEPSTGAEEESVPAEGSAEGVPGDLEDTKAAVSAGVPASSPSEAPGREQGTGEPKKVVLVCGSCGQKYRVPEIRDGRRRKCKLCQGVLYEEGSVPAKADEPELRGRITEEHLESISAEVRDVAVVEPPAKGKARGFDGKALEKLEAIERRSTDKARQAGGEAGADDTAKGKGKEDAGPEKPAKEDEEPRKREPDEAPKKKLKRKKKAKKGLEKKERKKKRSSDATSADAGDGDGGKKERASSQRKRKGKKGSREGPGDRKDGKDRKDREDGGESGKRKRKRKLRRKKDA